MDQETIDQKPVRPGLSMVTVIIVGLLCALIFGLLGYYFGNRAKTEVPETPVAETAVVNQAGSLNSPTSTAKTSTATNEIANWKTYSNDTYGFSFKFPSDWTLAENAGQNYDPSIASITSPQTSDAIKKAEENNEIVDYAPDISFYRYNQVADEPENKSNNWNATTLDDLVTGRDTITKIGETTLGGARAIETSLAGHGSYYTIFAVNNSELYKVQFGRKGAKQDISEVENQILSTFQFTGN